MNISADDKSGQLLRLALLGPRYPTMASILLTILFGLMSCYFSGW